MYVLCRWCQRISLLSIIMNKLNISQSAIWTRLTSILLKMRELPSEVGVSSRQRIFIKPKDKSVLTIHPTVLTGRIRPICLGDLAHSSPVNNYFSLHGHTNHSIMLKSWFYFTICNITMNDARSLSVASLVF